MTIFTVTGTALHDAAAWAGRIVPGRPTLPILGGLLIDAQDDGLQLTAFDLDTRGTVSVPAIVTEPGQVLVSSKLLTAIAKTITRDADLVITYSAGAPVAEVRCGRSEWTVPTLAVEDYPNLPDLPDEGVTVESDALRHALARVLPAVARDQTIQGLTGVRFEPCEAGMSIAATDRYRLAAAEVPIPGGATAPDVLAPLDLVEAAVRAMGDGPVILSSTDTTFGIATKTHRLVGRQIAEEYPRWQRLVPEPGEHRAVVAAADLRQSLDQARAMAVNDEAPVILTFGQDSVSVASTDGDRRAKAEFAPQQLDGDPVHATLKPGYLLDALAAVGADDVSLHFHKTLVLLIGLDATGQPIPGYRHLVMLRKGLNK